MPLLLLQEVVDAELVDEDESVLLYPSANHPPPLSWKELIDMIFFNDPLHEGHVFMGSSERLCQISIISSHSWHSYS